MCVFFLSIYLFVIIFCECLVREFSSLIFNRMRRKWNELSVMNQGRKIISDTYLCVVDLSTNVLSIVYLFAYFYCYHFFQYLVKDFFKYSVE